MPLRSTTRIPSTPTPTVLDGAVSFEAPALVAPSLTERRRELEEKLAVFRDQGYAEGHAAGLRAAEREVAEAIDEQRRAADRLHHAAAALERAAGELAAEADRAIGDLRHDVLEVAMLLAEQIVGHELAVAPEPVVDQLERAFALLPRAAVPVVRVHPSDAELVAGFVASGRLPWSGSTEVVADAGVETGGCVVEAGECRIDAQIGRTIERVRRSLA